MTPFRPGTLIALLNSRKPRAVSSADRWVRLTAALARTAASSDAILVAGIGCLHHDVALRAALDAGGRALLALGGSDGGAATLARRYPEAANHPRARVVADIGARSSRAERDLCISELAETVVVAEARPGGVVETISRERLGCGRAVLVCPPDGTRSTAGNARLLDAGAAPLPTAAWFEPAEARPSRAAPAGFPAAPAAVRDPAADRWDYLLHFTRGRPGEYPGESRWDYVGGLLRPDGPGVRDGFETLRRILSDGLLRAGSRLIRGDHRVVCMTDLHPAEVARISCWARHLVRWSFEPYAVGLRRDAAMRLGIRPVAYGPASLYASLPEPGRHLFQRHEPPRIDWSAEREWRAAGDMDLSAWRRDDALVVVPTEREARIVRAWTGFPVVALEGWPGATAAASPGS
ncbi:MAG: hypothetical protein QME96_08805 [Myxococcota bacterium]|nr:hypothetical protein [Myxococcota bacterium]